MNNIYIGWDARESIAYDVCKYSIERRTNHPINIAPLKHRELRKKGIFCRPWLTESNTGLLRDLIDNRYFSTEFSHTRFLVPALNRFRGWALFMDCDMIFLEDVKELFNKVDEKYALMVVKHRHKVVDGSPKMDDQKQYNYHRKNWSSFVLWNCAHPVHGLLSPAMVNNVPGSELHAFSWVPDHLIGHLGYEYNWIEGISPAMEKPKCIHYTQGGPWFEEESCKNVMYEDLWLKEYEHYMVNNSTAISSVPSTRAEG